MRRTQFVGVVASRNLIDFVRVSKLYRICRAVAWINPYVDEANLLRVPRRTDAANDLHLPPNAKRLVLLPQHHNLKRYGHCYWLLQILSTRVR